MAVILIKDKLELSQQSDDVIVIHAVGDHYFNILGHQRVTVKSIELVLHYSNISNKIITFPFPRLDTTTIRDKSLGVAAFLTTTTTTTTNTSPVLAQQFEQCPS